jgi:hypothetical protein
LDKPPRADCSTTLPSSSKRMMPASASTTSIGTCSTTPLVGLIGRTGE